MSIDQTMASPGGIRSKVHESSSSLLARLPPELWALIFSQFPQSTLASACRASRELRALCMPHLYSSIDLMWQPASPDFTYPPSCTCEPQHGSESLFDTDSPYWLHAPLCDLHAMSRLRARQARVLATLTDQPRYALMIRRIRWSLGLALPLFVAALKFEMEATCTVFATMTRVQTVSLDWMGEQCQEWRHMRHRWNHGWMAMAGWEAELGPRVPVKLFPQAKDVRVVRDLPPIVLAAVLDGMVGRSFTRLEWLEHSEASKSEGESAEFAV